MLVGVHYLEIRNVITQSCKNDEKMGFGYLGLENPFFCLRIAKYLVKISALLAYFLKNPWPP
jgi:hypothetical protein